MQTFKIAEDYVRKDCPDIEATMRELKKETKELRKGLTEISHFKEMDGVRQTVLKREVLNQVQLINHEKKKEEENAHQESKKKIKKLEEYWEKGDL